MRHRLAIVVAFLGLVFSSRAVAVNDRGLSLAFAPNNRASHVAIDHSAWAGILRRHLQIGADGINRFDYANVGSSDGVALAAYLSSLEKVSPSGLNAAEQHAYWINFYNALTVKVILDHYPVGSIRDITSGFLSSGPWDMPLVSVDGRTLTLNNIEHDILRADWREPRVHYALNCASVGCPNLQPVPYTGENLDVELDAAARGFVNHPRGVALQAGRLSVSKIYSWYAGDFGGTDAAIIAHLRHYASPQLASRLSGVSRIDSYQYDWRLNAPGATFVLR